MADQKQNIFYRGWSAALWFFGIALMVVYWPGISGAAIAPRWALLVVGVVPVLWVSHIRLTVLHLLGSAFVVWAFASYLWTAAPLDSIAALWKLVILACIFCVGSMCDDLKPLYFGVLIGLMVSGIVAISQVSDIIQVPDVVPYQATGLFANRLMMAEAAALIATALIAMREYVLTLFVLPALFLPCERGPILAFAFAGAFSLWRESKIAAISFVVGGLLFVAAITSGLTFNAQTDENEMQTRIESAAVRLTTWRAVLPEITLVGHGFGSFRDAGPQPVKGATLEHPHNEYLEIAFETGLIGIVLLTGFFAGAIYAALRSVEGVVILALMMEACFAFPLHEPATAAVGALCAGRCANRLPDLGRSLVDGRILLRRWMASCLGLLALDGKPQHCRDSVPIRSSLS